MGYRFLALLCLGFSIFSHAQSLNQVSWPLQKAFTPVGFDDNDRVQVAVSGEFPNTCFHVGPYTSKVDSASHTIFLGQHAYSYFAMCLQILLPFTQVIDVGPVPAGDYKIVDAASGSVLGKTSILRASNPGPDDFLYAIADDAIIRHESGKHYLNLFLRFTDRCTRLGRVDIHYYADSIVVQPIADRVADGNESCAAETTRVEHVEELKAGITGTFLLHVRSMNGQAINKIVDLD